MCCCTGARRCLPRQATGRQVTFRPTDTPRSRKGPWHVLLHRRTAMPPSAGDRPASDLPPDRHAPLEERPVACDLHRRAAMPPSAGDRPASDLPPDRHAPLEERPVACALHRRAAMPPSAGDRPQVTFRLTDTPRTRKGPWHVLLHRRAAMPPSAGDAAAHAHLRCLRRNSLKSWLQCVKIIKHTHGIRFAHTRVVCVNENCVLVFVSLKTHATTPQDALSFRTHLQGLRRVETRHAGLFPRTRHGLRERRMISGYPHMIDMCRRIPDI
jgi:hypothetical protein